MVALEGDVDKTDSEKEHQPKDTADDKTKIGGGDADASDDDAKT